MLISLSELRGWTARNDRPHAISDLLFDLETRRVVYATVGLSGSKSADALVAASMLRDPDPANGTLTMDLGDEDLARAPRWEGDQSELDAMLLAMPPLVVGPFGGTYAPLAMAAMAKDTSDAPQEDPRAEAARERFERLSSWLGKPVFASDGEVGIVADLLHAFDDNRLDWLVVDNDRFFHHRRRVVPFSAISHRAPEETGGHVVLTMSQAEVERAPQVADMELGD